MDFSESYRWASEKRQRGRAQEKRKGPQLTNKKSVHSEKDPKSLRVLVLGGGKYRSRSVGGSEFANLPAAKKKPGVVVMDGNVTTEPK